MTVVLTGRDLRRDELVRVARHGEPVELHADARARMLATRAVVEERLAAGDPVYGLSTAVGVLKRVELDPAEAAAYANRILRQHQVAQGEPAPRDLVRATMLCLANGFAAGSPRRSPGLADRLIEALNARRGRRACGPSAPSARPTSPRWPTSVPPCSRTFRSRPARGSRSSGTTPSRRPPRRSPIEDAAVLIDAMEARRCASSLEGMAANPSMLHPAIAEARPYPGLATSLANLRTLLDGSAIWEPASARNLQDPLSFRNLPQILGAVRDAFDHVDGQLAVELASSQGNPIVVLDERRVVSVADFEILPLAAALDYLRIVLASALGASAERAVKMLETPWSGLPTGLSPSPDRSDPGLSYLGIAVQSLAGRGPPPGGARVLTSSVSTAHAEGIEDRTSLAPLAARRLDDMVGLGARIVAIELAVAAQAGELRGIDPRGDRDRGGLRARPRLTCPSWRPATSSRTSSRWPMRSAAAS